MPLPQVNDRLKEIPAQALRTVFATIGQLLLVADRLRARAAGQLSGSGQADGHPASGSGPGPGPGRAPAKPARPARPDAETSRWRSLDKTGNVRVLDGDEEQDDEDVPSVSSGRSLSRLRPPAPPAEYTPTEVVPAVLGPAPSPLPAEPAPAEPAIAAEARRPGPADAAEPPPPSPGPRRADLAVRGRARCPEPAPPALAAGRTLPGPQLRPALGGLAAGPAAGAGRRPGPDAARLREGPREPPGRDHHVRAPPHQARRRAAEARAGASHHGARHLTRGTGPGPHHPQADQRVDRPSRPGLGRRPDRRADPARQHGVPDPA